MQISSAAALCSLLISLSPAFGQTAAPADAQNPTRDGGAVTNGAPGVQNPTRDGGTVTNGAPGVVPPLQKADPTRPEQAGRNALYKYLDDIAAKDEAARRAEIAKITTRAEAEMRQQVVRQKLLALMGGGFKKTPLNA